MHYVSYSECSQRDHLPCLDGTVNIALCSVIHFIHNASPRMFTRTGITEEADSNRITLYHQLNSARTVKVYMSQQLQQLQENLRMLYVSKLEISLGNRGSASYVLYHVFITPGNTNVLYY